ncbi:hypothetical protein WK24_30015 [Burkholderia vietnamiensis]|nr:hypothetical protein WK24_30015 [Burkholderia vietnamiensis]
MSRSTRPRVRVLAGESGAAVAAAASVRLPQRGQKGTRSGMLEWHWVQVWVAFMAWQFSRSKGQFAAA